MCTIFNISRNNKVAKASIFISSGWTRKELTSAYSSKFGLNVLLGGWGRGRGVGEAGGIVLYLLDHNKSRRVLKLTDNYLLTSYGSTKTKGSGKDRLQACAVRS